MVTGISYDNSSYSPCVACIEGQQARLPFPKKSYSRAKDVIELVHSDLCGPMSSTSFSGCKYFLTFIDDDVLRSDNGGEYVKYNFQKYLKENGICHQTTDPYSPQQNGVAERANRMIMEKVRCMLQDAGLDKQYWAEAVNTAVYIKTMAVKGCTPEEKWTKNKVR